MAPADGAGIIGVEPVRYGILAGAMRDMVKDGFRDLIHHHEVPQPLERL
jgi:hypothetical protein